MSHLVACTQGKPKTGRLLRQGYWGRIPILIFRRGYPYMEKGLNNKIRSGLLFVCFQNDINNGFEFIKKKFFNDKDFPVPDPVPHQPHGFTKQEKAERHSKGRFTEDELNSMALEKESYLDWEIRAILKMQ